MTRTLQQLAQEALDVQDACNLTGVANSFGRAMTELRRLLDLDSLGMREHPIARLWASKIHDLTSMGISNDNYGPAYEACHRWAKGEDLPKARELPDNGDGTRGPVPDYIPPHGA